MKTLGLDLGIASIGWAYLSEVNGHSSLMGWGSRIFEPGMEDDISSGKGVSRCTERRLKRAMRVQNRRRRERKDELIALLQEAGMLPKPLTPSFFTEVDNRLLLSFPLEIRKQVGHVLPYLYRKKALDKPLAKDELGRALYHLAQRRGYLSNRKQDLKNEEESGKVKTGIDKLKRDMEASGARTLGEYFCKIDPEQERIRGRYTERAMFQQEFSLICQAQRVLIPETLEKKLYHAIFFQRKLKSCKGLIGACRLYPEEQRCSYACEDAQLFRIYTNVNHLRIENKGIIRNLSENERKRCIEILNGFEEILTHRGTVTLTKLGKAIPLGKGDKFTLGEDDKEIYGNELHAILVRVFGESVKTMSAEDRQKFLHDLSSIEKEQTLQNRLRDYWHLQPEQIAEALKCSLPDEYCAYSKKALKELLPDLEAGIALNTIQKTNYPKTNMVYDLLPMFDSDECPIELRNPVVHRVMTELRRVVNALIERFGKPDVIRVELARDLKSTNIERERMTQQNRDREKARAAIALRIAKEAGIEKPSRNDILKVMLADECDFTCPYTGKKFTMKELLHGMSVHIEHIIPFSRSFDDSFRNKTLCEASANAAKNNRTPYEAYSGEEYQEILSRVRHFKGTYASAKLELFEQKEVNPEAFLERNLNDTRYASKLAMQYLSMLYGGMIDANGKQHIFAIAGGCTALVRRAWGGNYLLGEGEKVRTDHRHHAIDAMTIALTTPEIVKTVAAMPSEKRREMSKKMQPLLENNIYYQAKDQLESCAVSHHVVNKIRGAFHKETIYSKDYGKDIRHVRVALSDLEPKEVREIVDPAIQKIVLEKLGIHDKETLPDKEALKIFAEDKNLPVLLDKHGKPVNTIRFVRVKRKVTSRIVGQGDGKRAVANGANHLLAIFAETDAAGNETAWTGEIVSLLDAALKLKRGEPLFQRERPGLKFKFTLQKGDIVKFTKDGKEWLCIVRGVSLPQFYLAPIRDARMKKEIQSAKAWFQPTPTAAFNWKMQKFNMNLFGELQRAND